MMRQFTDEVTEDLLSKNAERYERGIEKSAAYIRHALYESCWIDAILPPETITDNTRFVYVEDDEKLSVIDEFEAPTYGAMSGPFSGGSPTFDIFGSRFRTYFDKITTATYQADVDRLVTYRHDIRQVFYDRILKEIQREKDDKAIKTILACIGPINTTMFATGQVQHVDMNSVITRQSWVAGKSILPKIVYDGGLKTATALMNNITVLQFENMGRDEFGGDIAQETMLNGFSQSKVAGINYCTTIKRSLLPDGLVLHFAAPEFLGVNYTYRDVQVFTEQRKTIISFDAQHWHGFTFANVGALCGTQYAV